MHTIFFARGPSFKQNMTISPYQNVQYMNLWMNLLGIEGAVETNGTIGFFDNILTNPPRRENPTNVIGWAEWEKLFLYFKSEYFRECPMIAFPSALNCSGNVEPQILVSEFMVDQSKFAFQNQLSAKLTSCAFSPSNIPLYSDKHCFQNYCENTVVVSRNGNNDKRRAIIEILSRDEASTPSNFTFVNAKYQNSCPDSVSPNSLTILKNSRELEKRIWYENKL